MAANREQSWRGERSAAPGACEWSLTLRLPRSGETQTVLIQERALKNGCRQWDGDGWTRLTLALATRGGRGCKTTGPTNKFKQVSVTSADNRKPLCSEGTSCSCQLAGFDVALGWPWWPLSLRSEMKCLWKLGTRGWRGVEIGF